MIKFSIKTVGELKEALERYADDYPIVKDCSGKSVEIEAVRVAKSVDKLLIQ